MRPTYIKAFGYELMIEPTSYSAFTYTKESANERELKLGKVRVIISKPTQSDSSFTIERYNHIA